MVILNGALGRGSVARDTWYVTQAEFGLGADGGTWTLTVPISSD